VVSNLPPSDPFLPDEPEDLPQPPAPRRLDPTLPLPTELMENFGVTGRAQAPTQIDPPAARAADTGSDRPTWTPGVASVPPANLRTPPPPAPPVAARPPESAAPAWPTPATPPAPPVSPAPAWPTPPGTPQAPPVSPASAWQTPANTPQAPPVSPAPASQTPQAPPVNPAPAWQTPPSAPQAPPMAVRPPVSAAPAWPAPASAPQPTPMVAHRQPPAPPRHGPPPALPAGGGSPILVQLGEVKVSSTTIHTPAGNIPLKGSHWTVSDQWHAQSKIPAWAIVCAILLFFVLCFLSLFFLLAKQTTYTGTVQITITNGHHQYVVRIPVADQRTVQYVNSQVNYVRSLATL
jgi:hypothetical protein